MVCIFSSCFFISSVSWLFLFSGQYNVVALEQSSPDNTSTESEIASYQITTIPYLITSSLRLQPGVDLKKALLRFVQVHKFQAVSIVTCVGSLQKINIRLASFTNSNNSDEIKKGSNYLTNSSKKYEIVSLVGTLENSYNPDNEDAVDNEIISYGHVHISIADEEGHVYGGHLMTGCIVYTTAEITIMEIPQFEYRREPCPLSGYAELSIHPRRRQRKQLSNNIFNIVWQSLNKIKHIIGMLKYYVRYIQYYCRLFS